MKKEVFNPWEITGEVDYNRLVKEFGLELIKDLPKEFNDNLLFRRGIVFASRDLGNILSAVKNKKPFAVMTGLMPTGKMHIGHVSLIKELVFWQKLGGKIYIAVADIEAYNARDQSLDKSRKIAMDEYILNYAALGLDLKKCEIYFQSARSKEAVKSNAYYRLQNLFSRHTTFNEFNGVYGKTTPGKMTSVFLQAADMFHPKLKEFEGEIPVLVPVGIDQDPHIRLARDMSKRLKEYKFGQISSVYHLFSPGLKKGKMSASDETSYIALSDDAKTVKNKINKYAFSGGRDTLEEHKEHGGNPDVDISFQYLKMLFEESDEKLAEIEQKYKAGEMLSGELKSYTIDKINAFLASHQKERKRFKKMVDEIV